MKKSSSFLLAYRLFSDKNGNKRISKPAVRIATIGVALGLAIMIISVSVIIGFKHTIRDKVIGFGSHITLANNYSLKTGELYPVTVNQDVLNTLREISGVAHVQKYAYKQGILKTDDDFLGVMFKGVDANYDTTFISDYLVEGQLPKFSDSASTNKIVISKLIANKLKLKSGDKIFAYFVGNNADVRTRKFTVEGIYETNLKRFDEVLCLTDFYTARKLNGWEDDQASGAEIEVEDFDNLYTVAKDVADTFDGTIDEQGNTYFSSTILNSYPQIFAWLDLLNLNIWVILALMFVVSGVTIISGLLIIILERTQMIGLLKAIGSRNTYIRKIFLWFAVFIISKGLVIGNIIGIGICLLQHHFGLVKLDASAYFVSTVPIEINPLIIIVLNVATLVICTLILIAPSYLISRIHPARSIRFE